MTVCFKDYSMFQIIHKFSIIYFMSAHGHEAEPLHLVKYAHERVVAHTNVMTTILGLFLFGFLLSFGVDIAQKGTGEVTHGGY
jgi:hypothetical protein